MTVLKKLFLKVRNLFDASLLDTRLAYGQNVALRKMLGIPKYLALPVWQQHGWYEDGFLFPPDFKDARLAGMMLVYSEKKRREWEARSDIPCRVGGLVLARYRRYMGWERRPDAKGTVFYAAHATSDTKVSYSVDRIHEVLSALPAEFKPVVVSLHPYDYYELKMNEEYERLGYEVVTAGPATSPDFPERFYEILSSCKYACSNDVGTYILYSLEMGIPFFFIGERVVNILSEDNFNDLPAGEFRFDDRESGKEVFRLFDTGPATAVTPEQRSWFERESGAGKEIPLEELRKIVTRPDRILIATVKMFFFHLAAGLRRIDK